MGKSLNVDERVRALGEIAVTIDGTVYRPVPVTTVERRELKRIVNAIRRGGRRVDQHNRKIERLQEDAETREEPLTDEEEQQLEEQIAALEAQIEKLDDESEKLTHQLLSAQLANDAGEHPSVELIATKVPAQVQAATFSFLSNVGGDDTDPTPTKPTESTSG